MKRLFVMLFVAFLAVPAMAQTYEIKTPYVSVNGYAEQEILPDEVYVQITLTESDSKGKITLEQQRRQMFSALKKCKIDVEKQLSMLDMASTYFKRRTSLASARYELKVGSAMEAQQVFEALDAVGISNVDITKVACSREEEYRAAVRKAAMQDARQKASELAEAVGQSVGDCLVINNTKVIPARLYGVKEGTEAKIEILLLKRKENDIWETLVKPGKKCKVGAYGRV